VPLILLAFLSTYGGMQQDSEDTTPKKIGKSSYIYTKNKQAKNTTSIIQKPYSDDLNFFIGKTKIASI
jgi:hypothetical protein